MGGVAGYVLARAKPASVAVSVVVILGMALVMVLASADSRWWL